MKFLSPEAFLFAATIPVVILFYLLKRRRTVKLVSSTLLWQKFLAETQANAPFQKLRHNWLHILQLLLLALAVLALARPFLPGQNRSSRLRVLILDASASMQSTDEKPTRFEHARAEALKLIDGLTNSTTRIEANDQMVILEAGANTEVKQSASSDKSALRRALQSCQPTDSPTRLSDALKLAETLVRNQAGAEIHLFSDGAVATLGEFENKNLPLVYHRIGVRAENLGIVHLDVRANPDNPTQRAVFATVQNFSTNAQSTEVELRFEKDLVDLRPVKLAPKEKLPLVFLAPQSRDGIFTVRSTTKDDLAADNQASIVSLLPQPVKVLLVSRGNRFLEKALRAASDAQVAVTATLADDARGFDLVVLDDVTPVVWPEGNVLAIHTVNTNWFDGGARIEAPSIVDWKNTHPLLRFVGLDNVQVSESFAVQAPSWVVPLVESPQTPLVLAGERGRQRIVWIGFDTLQSTWPLRVSFPIFIANAVEWLNPAAARNGQLTLRAGDPFRFAFPQPVAKAQLIRPDDSTRELRLDSNGRELMVSDTFQQGIYRVKSGTNEIAFAVNLMDAAESDIAPRDELPLGKYARVTATTSYRANVEWWRWLAAVGLGVLMFEWWFYHRRTA